MQMEPLLMAPAEVRLIAVALLMVFGAVLAYFGHRVYEAILAIIGAFLGFIIGYTIGVLFSGTLAGYILGILGALFLAFVFFYLVATAVALVSAAAVFFLANALGTGPIIALILAGAVFVIVFLAYDRIVILFTALVGAAMVIWGLDLLDVPAAYIIIVFVAIVASGVAVQWVDMSRKQLRPVESRSAAMKIDVAKRCPSCGQVLTYLPDYDAWFCYSCGRYS